PAVLSIADDGMPEGGQLDADLAPPSGAQAQLEACRVLAAREHPVARDGRLAFRAACRADAEVPVLREPALERRRVGAHVSLHERDVDALDGARLELGLEALLGFGRLGEHEEPGGLSVEPVHDEWTRPRPLRGQVVPQQAIDGTLPLALGRHGEKTGWLVHDDDGLVLVDEAQASRKGDAAAPAQLDAIVGAHDRPPVPGDAPADLHGAGLQPLLEASPGSLGVQRAQPLRQRDVGHPPRSTSRGFLPRSRKVPRKPTPSARSAAPATPETMVSDEPPQSMSSAQWPMLHASAVARSDPPSPAATPRSAYSRAKTLATRPR